jgi:hypothetical protein
VHDERLARLNEVIRSAGGFAGFAERLRAATV